MILKIDNVLSTDLVWELLEQITSQTLVNMLECGPIDSVKILLEYLNMTGNMEII